MIIDRFEGDFAVIELETGKKINMSKELLPSDAKEGNVIKIIVEKLNNIEQINNLYTK